MLTTSVSKPARRACTIPYRPFSKIRRAVYIAVHGQQYASSRTMRQWMSVRSNRSG